MIRNAIISALLLIGTNLSLTAQEAYQVKKEQDGLLVTYQFSELKGKRAEEGPQELCIIILNQNTYDVKVTFSLAFFKDGLVDEESAVIKLCIPAGKEMKGKKNGLCWLIDEDNDAKIKEDAFDWDLNDLTVEKTNSCK